jgi:hypothetical protein
MVRADVTFPFAAGVGDGGLNTQLAPLGSPAEHFKVTAALKPEMDATVTVEEPDCPTVIGPGSADTATEKSGPFTT